MEPGSTKPLLVSVAAGIVVLAPLSAYLGVSVSIWSFFKLCHRRPGR